RRPPAPDRPRSHSGRAHTDGFLEVDELNAKLIGVAGLRVFDEMWRTDGDVRKALTMVMSPIAGATWELEPAGGKDATAEDEKVAEFCRWALFEHMRPRLPSHILEALRVAGRSGFAPFEQVYTRARWEGRDVLTLKHLGLRLPRSVYRWITEAGELRAIKLYLVGRGDEVSDPEPTIPAEDLVYYRIGTEGDNWEGEPLLRPAYKHWKYKSALELVDAMAHERFAMGVPIAYLNNPPDGVDDTIEEALAGLRANEQGYIKVPVQKQSTSSQQEGASVLVEILQPERAHDLQDSLKYHSDRIAASVVEEFMRLGQGAEGARATADVQQDPFLAFCETIAQVVVEDTVNEQLIPRLVALNFSTDRLPRLRASLIDSTTLAELADYVAKLAGAGALHPDTPLDDFLRARADLPPADAGERQAREQMAEETREATVEGLRNPEPQESGDGATDPKGGPQKAAPANEPPKQMGRSPRALRPFEERMELDRIEASLDGARESFVAAGREAAVAVAAELAGGRRPRRADEQALQAALEDQLYDLYATGRDTVRSELEAQAAPTFELAEAAEGTAARLRQRARVAAEAVVGAIRSAISRARLESTDQATVRAAGEAAARGQLRAEAQVHAASALGAGRTDEAQANAEAIRGSYYTSILDGHRCENCAVADDDVLRPLSDPVRLARVPPNPDCFGGGRCRCLEAFVLAEEAPPSA
ncbi:MAG: phage portal protein family protein, partial [Thermoanaerobaculia bacterium]